MKNQNKCEKFAMTCCTMTILFAASLIICCLNVFAEPTREPEIEIISTECNLTEEPKKMEEKTPAPCREEKTRPEIVNPTIIKPLPEVTQDYKTEFAQDKACNSKYLGKFTLTAYCPCEICCGSYANDRPLDENGNPIVYTATGAIAREGVTVAVDPSAIPYGTELVINGHTYIAQDCGGAVEGNHIDIYFENHEDAWNFGTQYAEVFIVEG